MTTVRMTKNHADIRVWADFHRIAPVELLPCIVDHIPSKIQLLPASVANRHDDYRIITWQDFFAKFDQLGLTCVYDEQVGGSIELLPPADPAQRYDQPEMH